MNMWGFSPTLMGHLEAGFETFLRNSGNELKAEFFLPAAVDGLIHSNTVRTRVLPSPDSWFGVTYQDDKPHVIRSVQELIAKGIYPERLWD